MGSLGWNLSILEVDRDIQEFYLMFLSREIYINLCHCYTKPYIYWRFGIIFQVLNKSYLAFLRDIMDNIIETLHYEMTRIVTNGSAASLSRVSYNVTIILHCNWWKFWSRDTDISIIHYTYHQLYLLKNEKLLNSNTNRSKPYLFRLLWVIIVFRLVAYLLNMICLKLRFLYKISLV